MLCFSIFILENNQLTIIIIPEKAFGGGDKILLPFRGRSEHWSMVYFKGGAPQPKEDSILRARTASRGEHCFCTFKQLPFVRFLTYMVYFKFSISSLPNPNENTKFHFVIEMHVTGNVQKIKSETKKAA